MSANLTSALKLKRLHQGRSLCYVLAALAALAGPFGNVAVAQDRPPLPGAEGKILYLVEFVRTEKREKDTDRLIRATLKPDGNLTTETVLTAKAGFFREPGKSRIIDGRYIATHSGCVVDAKEKQIINDRGGELLGVEKGQVIYRVHNYRSPSFPEVKLSKEQLDQMGDFVFDLEKRTRTRPTEKHWTLDGLKSPNRTMAIFQGVPGTLWLARLDGMPKELGKGFHVTHSKYAHHTFTRTTPTLWLNNELILTQIANGKLVTVDTDGKVEPLCDIAGAPAVLDSPRLMRDPKRRIIYACGRAEFVIDVKKKAAAPLEEYALGHGFETTVETEARGFRTIYFEGKALGGGVFAPEEIRTAPEVIAKAYPGNQGSRRGVAVLWTKLGFAWRGIDLDYGGIIGWAN